MNLSIKKTKDGSLTFYSQQFGETYHSIAGALSESLHIYINNGLKNFSVKKLTIFEMGFGTGLNALLTYIYALENKLKINYIAIEKSPIPYEVIIQNFLAEQLINYNDIFLKLHKAQPDIYTEISKNFRLKKVYADIRDYEFTEKIDLCYYDAFSYNAQPYLWTTAIFKKIYQNMNIGGMLLTYSSKGEVKRALKQAGFTIKRFKGFGNKWHNLKAFKSNE